MYQNITKTVAITNKSNAMETRDHSKNGVSPKDQMSRGNILTTKKVLLALGYFILCTNYVIGQHSCINIGRNIRTVEGYYVELSNNCNYSVRVEYQYKLSGGGGIFGYVNIDAGKTERVSIAEDINIELTSVSEKLSERQIQKQQLESNISWCRLLILQIRNSIGDLERKANKTNEDYKKLNDLREELEEKQNQLKKIEGIRDGKSIRKSNVSSKEAIYARLNPELATIKDVVKYSNKAGLEQAKSGAVIGGSISIIKNVVALAKGEKDAEDAIIDVAKDTGSAVAVSYATGATGAALKGAMQNSKSAVIRGLSKSNLPAMLVTVTLETGKTLGRYFNGEIDSVQCLEELGEKGTGLVSSAVFAAIGQILIPIPVVGGLIGSMVGYALSSACYGQLTSALKNAKLARERRIQIEAECAEAIRMIREYRAEMEAAISEYLSDHIAVFHTAFDEIKTALNTGDIDGFISGANTITRKLGGKPQFENMSEFETLMESSDKLIL